MSVCDHEWFVEGPGVSASQLLIACGVCGVLGEAQVTAILEGDEGEDDD